MTESQHISPLYRLARRVLLAPLALASLSFAVVTASTAPAKADESYAFQSPTGNIHCVMETGEWAGVRCDVRELTPSFKRPPPDCDLDWGNAFFIGPQGKGVLGCVGDTVINMDARVLPYGRTATLGAFTCSSEKTGVTCTNGQGHGFSLSRAKQKLF